jgi:hypothetical protein
MSWAYRPSAHFPKFVLHLGKHFHELRKIMSTSKLIDSSAAYLFEVPEPNSPLVVQELQIGGTRLHSGLTKARRYGGEVEIACERNLWELRVP